jgi:hypothetical protein
LGSAAYSRPQYIQENTVIVSRGVDAKFWKCFVDEERLRVTLDWILFL